MDENLIKDALSHPSILDYLKQFLTVDERYELEDINKTIKKIEEVLQLADSEKNIIRNMIMLSYTKT